MAKATSKVDRTVEIHIQYQAKTAPGFQNIVITQRTKIESSQH